MPQSISPGLHPSFLFIHVGGVWLGRLLLPRIQLLLKLMLGLSGFLEAVPQRIDFDHGGGSPLESFGLLHQQGGEMPHLVRRQSQPFILECDRALVVVVLLGFDSCGILQTLSILEQTSNGLAESTQSASKTFSIEAGALGDLLQVAHSPSTTCQRISSGDDRIELMVRLRLESVDDRFVSSLLLVLLDVHPSLTRIEFIGSAGQ